MPLHRINDGDRIGNGIGNGHVAHGIHPEVINNNLVPNGAIPKNRNNSMAEEHNNININRDSANSDSLRDSGSQHNQERPQNSCESKDEGVLGRALTLKTR